MTLRARLVSGLSAFVGALVVLGMWSAWHLWRMSTLSERIIAENYDSVVAAQDMNESLERRLRRPVPAPARPDRALPQLREHRERFDAAVKRAAANVTEPGEAAIVEQIAADRDEYYRRFDGFVAALAGSADARLPTSPSAVYFSQLEPVFADIRRQCDRLLTVNQDAMRRKASEAAALARRWFLMTLGAALALVVAGAWFASALSASVLRPVTQLTEATNRLAAGDLDAVVAIRRGDELSVLGDRFNEMAGRLRQHRQSDPRQGPGRSADRRSGGRLALRSADRNRRRGAHPARQPCRGVRLRPGGRHPGHGPAGRVARPSPLDGGGRGAELPAAGRERSERGVRAAVGGWRRTRLPAADDADARRRGTSARRGDAPGRHHPSPGNRPV